MALWSDFYKYQFLTLCPRGHQEVAKEVKFQKFDYKAGTSIQILPAPRHTLFIKLRLYPICPRVAKVKYSLDFI